jgi:hypothetical protein
LYLKGSKPPAEVTNVLPLLAKTRAATAYGVLR